MKHVGGCMEIEAAGDSEGRVELFHALVKAQAAVQRATVDRPVPPGLGSGGAAEND